MPPIWSVESDDPNLAAVLERLVDIKKGNTLVGARVLGWGGPFLAVRPMSQRHPVKGRRIRRGHIWGHTPQEGCSLKPEGDPCARPSVGPVNSPRSHTAPQIRRTRYHVGV